MPVLNVKRASLRLLRNVEIELENSGAYLTFIPCAANTHVEEVLKRGGGDIPLIDHNEVTRHLSQLGELVTTTVDYRRDNGLYLNAAKIMARCGLRATQASHFITSDDFVQLEVAQLLLGVISSGKYKLKRRAIEQDH